MSTPSLLLGAFGRRVASVVAVLGVILATALPALAGWRELKSVGGGAVFSIVPGRNGALWIVTAGGIHKSTDTGESWTPVNGDLPSPPTREMPLGAHATDAGVYVWTDTGLYKTTSGGVNWARLPLDLPAGVYASGIAIAPSDPSVVYLATWGDYAYRSSDGGATWERRVSALSSAPNGSFLTSMAVDPTNANRVYTSTFRGRLFRSDDAATTWYQIADNGTWANSQIYVAPSSPNVLYTTHDEMWFGRGSFLKSADYGDTWTSIGRPASLREGVEMP